jgi:hypothetical protein
VSFNVHAYSLFSCACGPFAAHHPLGLLGYDLRKDRYMGNVIPGKSTAQIKTQMVAFGIFPNTVNVVRLDDTEPIHT